jgi:nodulation protein E
MRRVVITGVGVISPIGNNAPDFWESIRACRSGIDFITKADVSQARFRKAGEVKGFVSEEHFDDKSLFWLDLFAQYGIVSAREAVKDSGIEFTDELKDMTGVLTGSCLGGITTEDGLYYKLYVEKVKRQPPISIPKCMSNAAASHISMEFGVTGATLSVSTACSSANHAMGQAFWFVRQGTLDVAIAGGAEAPIAYGNLGAWETMRVVSPDTCRPFSKERSGMVLGEGGAMFIMEELEHARARGAKIYAEIVGFGMSADAHHLTMPLAEGASKAMKLAMKDGGLAPEQVGYINAHGTATQANDVMETNAIRMAFGSHADKLAVSSTKSMTGHSLGAAGAIEAAATILGMHNKILPPTANFISADPECDLDVIPNESRPAEVEAAISNSFAFGGLNAVLAFKTWNG